MPHVADRISRRDARWKVPTPPLEHENTATYAAPPIDDSSTAIDELAFVLATDHLSIFEKIWLLEQWRYDMLLLDVASGEGLGAAGDDGVLLQQVNKALLRLSQRLAWH